MEIKLDDSKVSIRYKILQVSLIQHNLTELKIWIQFTLHGNYSSFSVPLFQFNVITMCAVSRIFKA